MLRSLAILAAFVGLAISQTTFQPSGIPFQSPVTVASGLAANVIFSNVTAPRGIALDSLENLLVVERGFGVTAFTAVSSPSAGYERKVVFTTTALTQGIQVDGSNLYVSTAGEVHLYNYNAATKSVSSTTPTVIISGVPADGELTTHVLQLEKNRLGQTTGILVGSGPLTNIDTTARNPASGRSQVRRFPLPGASLPQSWSSGTLIAYGIRNPAGLAFQSPKKLFVVENGASIDSISGLTAQFVNDNPADELEAVKYNPKGLGKFFGFPDCTTLWNPTADPVGVPQYTSWSQGDQFSLNLDPLRNDAWCQSASNNVPPALSFQSHSVPLDIKFYQGITPGSSGLPSSWLGDALVSFRGSFNRSPPTGYGVVRVPFPLSPPSTYNFIVQATNLNTCPGTCIRPVGLAVTSDGRLYVSSDSSREIFLVTSV